MENTTELGAEPTNPAEEKNIQYFTEEKIEIPESRGERLVGITFNPSADPEVDTVKRACAYLIDVIEKHREDAIANGTLTANREFLMNHALGEVVNAQMNVVKVITFK